MMAITVLNKSRNSEITFLLPTRCIQSGWPASHHTSVQGGYCTGAAGDGASPTTALAEMLTDSKPVANY